MTGPEHYKEAEHLQGLAEGVDWTDDPDHAARFATAALVGAQVHATLALAAATALTARGDSPDERMRTAAQEWWGVIY